MPEILARFNASVAVAVKIKAAMVQRRGESLTPGQAKAEFRKMVKGLAINEIRSYLRDAHNAQVPDSSDVDLTD
jgi:hypothetical protein